MNTPNLSGSCTAAGSFTPNWGYSALGGNGSAFVENTSNSVALYGPNGYDAYNPNGYWSHYLTNIPSWVTRVSFVWTYASSDYGNWDRGYFFANGGWVLLANNDGRASNVVVTNFVINPGGDRRFGPGVFSVDACCGAGYLRLYNVVFQ